MGEKRTALPPKGKFLIVDVDIGTLSGFTQALHKEGYEVQACTSYDEALACLGREAYDFILVDQGGPQFEGRLVLDRAIEVDRHTPVLVITRLLDMACYLDAMYMGAVDYLVKPIPYTSLMRVIGSHMRQRYMAA